MSSIAWSGIVKVQRSIAPIPDRTVLITDECGQIHAELTATPDILKWFKKDEQKFYAFARLPHKSGIINLERKVKPQPW